MTLTIIISVLTCIFLILSIIKFPTIKIKKIKLKSFWIIAIIGALLMLIIKRIPLSNLIEILMGNSAINP